MLVQAKKGARCPKENKPREYITDREPEDVPESAYYLRLIADGSLVAADVRTADAGKKKGGKE